VLNVRRLGYAPVRVAVTVAARGTRTLDIAMATSALQLEQVTITAARSYPALRCRAEYVHPVPSVCYRLPAQSLP
jgi:hypothetical protein